MLYIYLQMELDFNYPIITFVKAGYLYFARGKSDLDICSIKAWKSGFYEDLRIVDCDGNFFVVNEAIKIGYNNFLWGLNILCGQKIKVELKYEKIKKEYSLKDFKNDINKFFSKEADFWDSGVDLAVKKRHINSQESFKEVIEYLTAAFYRES